MDNIPKSFDKFAYTNKMLKWKNNLKKLIIPKKRSTEAMLINTCVYSKNTSEINKLFETIFVKDITKGVFEED